MIELDLMQYTGAVLGPIGLWLIGEPTDRRRLVGFTIGATSSALLLAWGATTGAWGIAGMQLVYLLLSVRGARNNRGR